MIIAYGNNLIGFNNRVIDWDIPNTPWTFNYGPDNKFDPSYPNSLYFRFLFPASVTVDWGDGNVIVYTSVDTGVGNTSIGRYFIGWQRSTDGTLPAANQAPYVYADGVVKARTIKVYFNNRSALFSISEVAIPSNQALNLSFAQFPALNSIYFNTTFTPLNVADIAALPNLQSFNAPMALATFPIEIFLTKLTSFVFVLNALNYDVPFSTSNIDKLALLKNTLVTLTIQNILMNTDGNQSLPDNCSQLTIQALTLNGPSSSLSAALQARKPYKMPSAFEQLVSLTSLTIAYGLSDWSNLAGLTNLTALSVSGYSINYLGTYVSSDLPSFLTATTKIKAVTASGIFRAAPNPQSVIDAFITNIYNFVSATATKAVNGVSNSLPLRGMTWKLLSGSGNYVAGTVATTADQDVTTKPPSGVYQQPTGYVKGTSNGSPASPMEMVWVLTAQYGWAMSFATPFTGATTSNMTITAVKSSSSILAVTFNCNVTNNAGNSNIWFGLTYLSGGVSTTIQTSVTLPNGASATTANISVPTAGITQVSVTVNSMRQNPLNASTNNPTYIMYSNPYIINF